MQHGNYESKKGKSISFRVIVIILILIIGGLGAFYLIKTSPKPKKRAPKKTQTTVETIVASKSNQQIIVQAMGVVIPAKEISLKSQVQGKIISVNNEFMEGGSFKKGNTIVKIDDTDYELALINKKSQLENAIYELKLEKGRQDVAKREWQALNKNKQVSDLDLDLALRKPHLKKVEAELAAAKAQVRQEELNIERTNISAPFNAIIREKYVDIGYTLSTHEQIALLVGTDEYWIQVSIPIDKLKWIKIPKFTKDIGSEVTILYGTDQKTIYKRVGKVIKLLSDLEEEGKMARILISVNDPLDLNKKELRHPPLLIGSYVNIEIHGTYIDNVFKIPRIALKDNSKIWIAQKNNTLDIRDIQTIWRDFNSVLIVDGINENEKIIVSDISAPVQGMSIDINTLDKTEKF